MEKKNLSRLSIAAIILSIIGAAAFFLPISTAKDFLSFDFKNSFNILDIFKIGLGLTDITNGATWQFKLPFMFSCWLLILVFAGFIALIVLTIMQSHISVRRVLAVGMLIATIAGGFLYNTDMTAIAKTGNNYYNVYPEFKMVIKTKTGSVNSWSDKIDKLLAKSDEAFAGYDNADEIVNRLKTISAEAALVTFDAKDSVKKKMNKEIFEEIQSMIPYEDQVDFFKTYFKTLTKSVTAVSSTFGVGMLVLLGVLIVLCGVTYSELNPNGFKSYGIKVNVVYSALMLVTFFGTLFVPILKLDGTVTQATGLSQTSLFVMLLNAGKISKADETFSALGIEMGRTISSATLWLIILILVLSVITMGAYLFFSMQRKGFKVRRILAVTATVLYIIAGLWSAITFKDTPVGVSVWFVLFLGIMICNAIIPFTSYSDKEKLKVFSIINVVLFLIISAFIIVPLWKVLVDSLDMSAGYGMRIWPQKFTLLGYRTIITSVAMYKPFLISCVTTVAGTVLGLLLSTLGGYVLIQFEMPGRNFLAGMLLFTMIFQGGMIPTYLVMCNLGIINTLWAVILPLSISVYNLVLMRNFFEGIPKSLFESAQIDGCSPMGIFVKIVLPLSKAALASIGLMFAVSFWNDYTNYKIYITNSNLFNFQMKLRSMIFSSDMPNNTSVSQNTLQNAAIIVAIIPFMIIYPFCQQYFVKGVNIGAVKE